MQGQDVNDRARGLLMGIAVGNLLGIRQEGWPREVVAARYPDGVREIEATTGFPDDDDLAQAIVIAEAAEAGPLDVDDLGERFWEWAETNGAGMGGLTGDVLTLYGGARPQKAARNAARARRAGADPKRVRELENAIARTAKGKSITEASRTAWAAWGGGRAGNGAAMRCTPIAVRWRDDPAALVRNSLVSAVPTHWDPRCGWSCALLNLAAAAALDGASMTADELLEAGLEGMRAALAGMDEPYAYEARIPDTVRGAVDAASESPVERMTIDGDDRGFTLLALQVGLSAYWRAASFEQGLRSVIESGGDTDTNGAVVGALLGARFGFEAIPPRWRAKVAEIRAGRTPMESWAERLLGAG